MSLTKKTYTLGKIKQLIDLNGDSTNFDLSFKVSCKDETPFNILVVDQTTLDNTPELNYKDAKNVISGNIVADKNIYQNYFLILKSETPCVVDVEINKNELPKTPNITIPSNQNQQHQQHQQNFMTDTQPDNPLKSYSPPASSMSWTKIILIGVVVVGGLILLYYLYKRKNSEPQETVVNSEEKFTTPSHNYTVPQNSPIKNSLITPQKNHTSSSSDSSYSNESVDVRSFRPKLKYQSKIDSTISPDVMSRQSSDRSNDGGGDEGGMSLIDRLKRFSN